MVKRADQLKKGDAILFLVKRTDPIVRRLPEPPPPELLAQEKKALRLYTRTGRPAGSRQFIARLDPGWAEGLEPAGRPRNVENGAASR
jgi:hypothetical protein